MHARSIAWAAVVLSLAAVSPGVANVAPLFTSMPDIIISDVEQNTATNENNFFVFSDALDIDESVITATTEKQYLRWSFIERSPGGSIEINGIGSNTSGNTREPGPFDFRAVSRYASFRNVRWSPPSSNPPYQETGADRMESVIEVLVSDGANTASQIVTVVSLDDNTAPYDDGPRDGLTPQPQVSYSFDQDVEGWQWFSSPLFREPVIPPIIDGSLEMTLPPGLSQIAFGAWESPKDPALAVQPRLGCIQRTRFHLRSSLDGPTCPGIRMRAVTTPVVPYSGPGGWIPDFLSQDFNADLIVNFFTPDVFHIPGREPSHLGSVYDILSWPEQTESLMSSGTITYFTCDLLDLDAAFDDDAGTIYIDHVDIDEIDSPDIGKGRAEPHLTFTDFSSWSTGVTPIAGGTAALPTVDNSTSAVTIAVTLGDQWFEAWALGPALRLEPGRYYRVVFTVTSSAYPGGDFGPTLRAGLMSSRFVWSADKTLAGGGLLSAIGPVPQPYVVWVQAPSAVPGTTLTEPLHLRFESWLCDSSTGFPFYKNVSGTLRCLEVFTESFPPF